MEMYKWSHKYLTQISGRLRQSRPVKISVKKSGRVIEPDYVQAVIEPDEQVYSQSTVVEAISSMKPYVLLQYDMEDKNNNRYIFDIEDVNNFDKTRNIDTAQRLSKLEVNLFVSSQKSGYSRYKAINVVELI